jgi:programmed cell death 6-interacting protein
VQSHVGRAEWEAGKGTQESNLKTSCALFQSAAGLLTYLTDTCLDMSQHVGACQDTSQPVVGVFAKMMMAQAHECFVAKALLENMKNMTVARICAQVCNDI